LQYRPLSSGSQKNFDSYAKYAKSESEYKYNIYSIIDEPWNRCCEVGHCGTCSGNECIARRAPPVDWQ
jgi:N-acetylneuraminic acid mutarotase